MSRSTASPVLRAMLCAIAIAGFFSLTGCAVITIAGAAVGVAATGAGLAVDAAVGAVKLTGSAVGAVLPSGGDAPR
jgi:hypothetical protein